MPWQLLRAPTVGQCSLQCVVTRTIEGQPDVFLHVWAHLEPSQEELEGTPENLLGWTSYVAPEWNLENTVT